MYNGPDENYGLAQPLTDFLSDDEIKEKKSEFIKSLNISATDKKKLEFDTRNQANNNNWFIERRNRLTASNFGKVCKMRPSTSCKAMVHNILYSNPQTNTIEYDKLTEESALRNLEEQIQKPIQKCGLFIDERKPYLAATPGKNVYLMNLSAYSTLYLYFILFLLCHFFLVIANGLVENDFTVEIKCPFSVKDYDSLEQAVLEKKVPS